MKEIEGEHHAARDKKINGHIGQSNDKREVEGSPAGFLFENRIKGLIRGSESKESVNRVLRSVLKKAYEKKDQGVEEKELFPAAFGEDKGPLHPEKLKGSEGVQDCNHSESEQVRSHVPDIES